MEFHSSREIQGLRQDAHCRFAPCFTASGETGSDLNVSLRPDLIPRTLTPKVSRRPVTVPRALARLLHAAPLASPRPARPYLVPLLLLLPTPNPGLGPRQPRVEESGVPRALLGAAKSPVPASDTPAPAGHLQRPGPEPRALGRPRLRCLADTPPPAPRLSPARPQSLCSLLAQSPVLFPTLAPRERTSREGAQLDWRRGRVCRLLGWMHIHLVKILIKI
ncbi:uncharacterized protein [Alexandromys fortis]|uniref:uncharacterized protein n=1 Tax=Alexandromys fortis TaxID=100897 RepID=UPI00215376C1|nr:uncharacterized protein LOC126502273 [Microtus fortis]